MKNTLAYQLAEGSITPIQADDILDALYESVTDSNDTSIFFGDLSIIGRQGVEMLTAAAPKEFCAHTITFDGIEFIKTKNINMWRLYAMNTPYNFEGETINTKGCPF